MICHVATPIYIFTLRTGGERYPANTSVHLREITLIIPPATVAVLLRMTSKPNVKDSQHVHTPSRDTQTLAPIRTSITTLHLHATSIITKVSNCIMSVVKLDEIQYVSLYIKYWYTYIIRA